MASEPSRSRLSALPLQSVHRKDTTAHFCGEPEESSGSVPWMEGRSTCRVCGVEGASSEH